MPWVREPPCRFDGYPYEDVDAAQRARLSPASTQCQAARACTTDARITSARQDARFDESLTTHGRSLSRQASVGRTRLTACPL